MARPREFDEAQVLDAAIECFWSRGYEATSVRELAAEMGIGGASLYNTFGDKRALFRRALELYVERMRDRRAALAASLMPREAIAALLMGTIDRALADKGQRGCLMVNAAMELAARDPELRRLVAAELAETEAFFHGLIATGQRDRTISGTLPSEELARHLLGVLLGIRVLARARPYRELLECVARPALSLLDDPRPSRETARDENFANE
jgi:TetR/AcrR family transcriptional repressor of nem operon